MKRMELLAKAVRDRTRARYGREGQRWPGGVHALRRRKGLGNGGWRSRCDGDGVGELQVG